MDNPDGATGGLNSGVINYINKFSDAAYKSLDPVSELFYESIRYFKNLGPTPEYAAGLTNAQKGGFQVVDNWTDPQQFKCQKNFIIAINDANPWLDKRLPGTYFTIADAGRLLGYDHARRRRLRRAEQRRSRHQCARPHEPRRHVGGPDWALVEHRHVGQHRH